MATGAAKEAQLGLLHATLTKVFKKILDGYLDNLEKAEQVEQAPSVDVEDQLMEAALELIPEPNPTMLAAISKFLKDNDIGMDTKEVEDLNRTQELLAQSKERRRVKGINLSSIPPVEEHMN